MCLIDAVFFRQDCGMYCMHCMYSMSVIRLFHCAECSPLCNSYYLFTLLFLSKQTRHARKVVSFLVFLFISGRAKCLSREQCVGSRVQE